MSIILGIDVGGSGIKGALVDTEKGDFASERHRIETPKDAKPEQIAKIIAEIAEKFEYKGLIGVGFPAVIDNGVIKTAANISKKNIGVNAKKLFSKICRNDVYVINDADAAGIAEMRFGHAKNNKGKILVLTIGTGIGSALFYDGKLIPNTEFGHIFTQYGLIAEKYASAAVRKNENLKWKDWGKRFNEVLILLDKILNPQMFILGGGISKKFEKYAETLELIEKVKPAKLFNKAGIIGAAIYAENFK